MWSLNIPEMNPVRQPTGMKKKTKNWQLRTEKIYNGKDYEYVTQQPIKEKILSKNKISKLLK